MSGYMVTMTLENEAKQVNLLYLGGSGMWYHKPMNARIFATHSGAEREGRKQSADVFTMTDAIQATLHVHYISEVQ